MPVFMSLGLVLHNTEVLSGEPVLYNRFMHVKGMAMKVRQPSP